MLFISLLFWLSSALVFHSYVVYPLILRIKSRGLKQVCETGSYEPDVDILMAVHNAEAIVEEKVRSVLQSNYPSRKIHFYIGSDASTDETNSILKRLEQEFPQLQVTYFSERSGKIRIINALFDAAQQRGLNGHILISTDATALFQPDCIRNLVRHFTNDSIAAVGANIIKEKQRSDGISKQEKAYYDRELLMKHEEGLIWGTSIGVFGACYAIRPEDFNRVPEHYLVDDFFITMSMLERGRKVVYDMDACVTMNLANESRVEFRRKVRIAAGNFQNLSRFYPLLFRMNGLAFAFLSHKVLRWFGPFLLLISFITSLLLYHEAPVYLLATWVQVFLYVSPGINYALEKLNVHHKFLKFIAHFFLMNFGIFCGFFKYLIGVKSSVWEPTRR